MARLVFQPALEGLRGVSVLAVLVFHAETVWLPGGFLGVSTFFTLSGFLITGLLVREWEETGSIGLGAFWGRRLRRLLPASLLALAAIAFLGPTWSDGTQQERLAGDGLAALLYFSNWWLIVTGAAYDDLMGSPSVVQHFWSLSVEEQYYFVYPLVAFGLLRASGGSRRVFGAVLVAATLLSWGWMSVLAATDVTTARVYYGTDTRAGELLAGGALALLLIGRGPRGKGVQIAWIMAGVVGLAVTAFGWAVAEVESFALYDGGLAVYALGTLAVIAASVQPAGPVRVLLSWAPLRWLGRVSYGAYVYHWPIFLWVESNLFRIALTLAVADLSYRLVEEPIRSGRLVRGWTRFVVPPVAIGAVALALAFAVPEEPLPAIDPAILPASAAPALDRQVRIAVFGDSLARDVAQGLKLWATGTDRVRIQNNALPGCGIARGAWPPRFQGRRDVCERWVEMARRRLPEFAPDVVVVVTSGWDLLERQIEGWDEPRVIGDPAFDRWLTGQYEQAFELFRRSGAKVVWLTTPCRKNPFGPNEGSWDPARSRHLNEQVLPFLARRHEGDLSIIDFDAAICPGGEFTKALHGIPKFRKDGTHLSRPAKLWVGTWLGEAILSSVPIGDAQGAGSGEEAG